MDKWYLEEGITCLDYLSFPDGGIIFAFGTQNAKIIIRIDWEESPSFYQCTDAITAIKFSSDGYYMIATCINGHCYVFTFTNGGYFQYSPKEFVFDSESPADINLSDDNKMIILSGSRGTLYKVDLPEMKYRLAVQESDRFSLRYMSVIRTDQTKPDKKLVDGMVVLGNEMNYMMYVGNEGNLIVWKNLDQFQNRCGDVRFAHCGRISSLAVNKHQNTVLTLGNVDGTLKEWKGN